jgi:hypothetical protein
MSALRDRTNAPTPPPLPSTNKKRFLRDWDYVSLDSSDFGDECSSKDGSLFKMLHADAALSQAPATSSINLRGNEDLKSSQSAAQSADDKTPSPVVGWRPAGLAPIISPEVGSSSATTPRSRPSTSAPTRYVEAGLCSLPSSLAVLAGAAAASSRVCDDAVDRPATSRRELPPYCRTPSPLNLSHAAPYRNNNSYRGVVCAEGAALTEGEESHLKELESDIEAFPEIRGESPMDVLCCADLSATSDSVCRETTQESCDSWEPSDDSQRCLAQNAHDGVTRAKGAEMSTVPLKDGLKNVASDCLYSSSVSLIESNSGVVMHVDCSAQLPERQPVKDVETSIDFGEAELQKDNSTIHSVQIDNKSEIDVPLKSDDISENNLTCTDNQLTSAAIPVFENDNSRVTPKPPSSGKRRSLGTVCSTIPGAIRSEQTELPRRRAASMSGGYAKRDAFFGSWPSRHQSAANGTWNL